ncbi:MAG: hypothetical protein K8L97_34255 [Anaerolineae bacterium]|nr:hypothetical protein [Anaerolineae bacterium]
MMYSNLLESGEYQFGCYKVQHVEWIDGEWNGDGYWQQALVTNRRLIVFPEMTERAKTHESIKPSDIIKVWNACLRGRDGILMVLKNGRHLYMLVDWSQGSKLVKDINSMLQPIPLPRISPRSITN